MLSINKWIKLGHREDENNGLEKNILEQHKSKL